MTRLGTDVQVVDGSYVGLVASVTPFRIREPVQVVAVVDVSNRCRSAYGTCPVHPVTGEEAFVVHRTAIGRVWFTMRSLVRPGRGRWRLVFPVLLLAQRWYRRRCVHTL